MRSVHRIAVEEDGASLFHLDIDGPVLLRDYAAALECVDVLEHGHLPFDFLHLEQGLAERARIHIEAAVLLRYIRERDPYGGEFPTRRADEAVVLVRLETRRARLTIEELRLYSRDLAAENSGHDRLDAGMPERAQEGRVLAVRLKHSPEVAALHRREVACDANQFGAELGLE